ncbi:hypothetical protein D3C72_2234110 [compost metagenome]
MRFRQWRVVHVATNITVVIFFDNLISWNNARIARERFSLAICVDNFINILRTQMILCFIFAVFTIGVDKQN